MDANAMLAESALGAALRLGVRVVDVSSLVIYRLARRRRPRRNHPAHDPG